MPFGVILGVLFGPFLLREGLLSLMCAARGEKMQCPNLARRFLNDFGPLEGPVWGLFLGIGRVNDGARSSPPYFVASLPKFEAVLGPFWRRFRRLHAPRSVLRQNRGIVEK